MPRPLVALLPALCLVLLAAVPAVAQTPAIKFLEGHTAPVYSVSYSPDGRLIVSGGLDRTVRVWDRTSGQLIRTIADADKGVLAVAVSRDNRLVASAGLDRAIRIHDMPLRDQIGPVQGL